MSESFIFVPRQNGAEHLKTFPAVGDRKQERFEESVRKVTLNQAILLLNQRGSHPKFQAV